MFINSCENYAFLLYLFKTHPMTSTMQESLYFLAIIPPKDICEKIYAYKEVAFEKFGSKASLNSPAHITLHMPFKWKLKKEQLLIEKLQQFRFDEFLFSISLNNFAFFEPRVVYINVPENEKLNKLQKELSQFIRRELNIFNADYKDRPFHPHITIAFRDLKKSAFSEAKAFFSNEKYETEFEAMQFCLLKHNGNVWQQFIRFAVIG